MRPMDVTTAIKKLQTEYHQGLNLPVHLHKAVLLDYDDATAIAGLLRERILLSEHKAQWGSLSSLCDKLRKVHHSGLDMAVEWEKTVLLDYGDAMSVIGVLQAQDTMIRRLKQEVGCKYCDSRESCEKHFSNPDGRACRLWRLDEGVIV